MHDCQITFKSLVVGAAQLFEWLSPLPSRSATLREAPVAAARRVRDLRTSGRHEMKRPLQMFADVEDYDMVNRLVISSRV